MRWLAILALVATATGCSVVNDTANHQPEGVSPPVPANEFCSELAMVVCDAYQNCCSMPTVSYDTCVTNGKSTCASSIGPVLADDRAGYDPDVAAVVLAEGRELVAQCDPGITSWLSSREGFLRVLTGSVEGGGECTPRNLTDYPAYFSCIARDQACVNTGSGRWICADLQAEGKPCNGNQDCQDGLWCDGAGFFTPGTCAARLPNGADCTQAASCQSLVCDTSGDAGAGKCVSLSSDAYCNIDLL